MKKTHTRIFAALMAAAAVTLTACGAGGAAYDMMTESANRDYNNFYAADTEMSVSSSVESPSAIAGGSFKTESGLTDSANTAADPLAQRKIVRTLRITAETKTFDESAAAIEAL